MYLLDNVVAYVMVPAVNYMKNEITAKVLFFEISLSNISAIGQRTIASLLTQRSLVFNIFWCISIKINLLR